MIERTWKGIAEISNADIYIEHLKADTFPKVRKITGNIDARVLRRYLGSQVEFLVITTWTSMDAIKAFAGENIEVAVVPAKAQAALSSYDEIVRHYKLIER